MDIEQERQKIQALVDEINTLTDKNIQLGEKQQGLGEKNISIRGSDGTLWVTVATKNYDIGLSGESIEGPQGKMYKFMCNLTCKEQHDKYGYPNKEKQPKWETSDFDIVKKSIFEYAGVKKQDMPIEVEFYPNDENEFKQKCAESKKIYWIVYKDSDIFYHDQAITQGNFDSPLRTYLKTCTKGGIKITNIPGITKIRAFASDEFLQNKGNKLEKVLFAEEFYFEKIRPLLGKFLNYDINNEKVNEIIHFIGKNTSLNKVLEKFDNEGDFIKLLAQIISISDIRASNKSKYTPYKDERTIGSGLNQPQWMKGFLNYKLNQNVKEGVIKNLVDYANNPLENISMLSNEHRNKISQQLFKKNYEKGVFIDDLEEYFNKNEIYFNADNSNNKTTFMANILYGSLKGKWSGSEAEINNEAKEMQEITLLKLKKQIILQGSPGTGKTRLAEEISKQIAPDNYKLIQFHPAYSYEDFVRGIVAETDDNGNIKYEVKNKVLAEMAENAINSPDDKFVLIIDEINRANLSSVLGELIYALEYRNEAVESMYKYQGSRKIILPENLYIIGTMNTADRSVGHIDYAIRRRFAFVDVSTDESIILLDEAKSLFTTIKSLFNDYLSDEFELNDVMIGHSYFLKDDKDELALALDYEIKPILQEYRKDGVLTCEKKQIDNLTI